MGASNLLTGVCMCTLALVDALTLGEFGHHGARWEGGPGCQATGWVWVFASEASVLLLTLAAVQCGVSVTCARTYGKSPSLVSVRTCALFCLVLSITLASLPLAGVGEYGSSPFCLPSPLPPPSSRLPSALGFPLALIMMNTLCLLIVTGSHIRLYWELLRGECEGLWDCAMIKHVAWLIFTNGLLYVPVAFLSLCSLLGLLSLGEEVLKSVLLLLQPLPACLNPLLFLLFTRDHSQLFFWPRPKARTQLRRDHTLDSLVSVDTEKSSCSDSSTQVSLTDATYSGGSSLQPRQDPIRFSHCSSTSSVPLIPCQIPPPTARDRERVAEWERERVSDWWFLESLDQDVYHTAMSLTLNPWASTLAVWKARTPYEYERTIFCRKTASGFTVFKLLRTFNTETVTTETTEYREAEEKTKSLWKWRAGLKGPFTEKTIQGQWHYFLYKGQFQTHFSGLSQIHMENVSIGQISDFACGEFR